ncbi:MAG: ATP-binding protein [Pseudomonadota bacterium]
MDSETGGIELDEKVSGLADLGRLLTAFSAALEATGASDRLRRRALLVMEELTANVLSHAGEGVSASLRLRAVADEAAIKISYPGPAFDPTDPENVPIPNPDRPGGHGLRLIQALSTHLCYVRHTNRNSVHAFIRQED